MLQNVRDNMKGTVAVIVVLLFIVPMVLTTGVGRSFLNNVAGTDAADVDGEAISKEELSRAVYSQRQNIIRQTGGDGSEDYLSDDNLRGPVLNNLTRRLALVRGAENAGMAISDQEAAKEIRQQKAFYDDAGKFDTEKYKRLLRANGFTPATYLKDVRSGLLLAQQSVGLEYSAFVTDKELEALVKIVHQKRSFYSVKIPSAQVESAVAIEAPAIQAYYDANQASFSDPEKVNVEYLELSIDELAKTVSIADEDVEAQYQQELAAFTPVITREVAHILIEGKDDDSRLSVQKEVAAKLAAGGDFAALAKEYSADVASKDNGGVLGVMTEGMFPESFEKAVLALDEGQVSEPVTTDSGVHFIKLMKKAETQAPTFESRKAAIKNELARVAAEDIFVEDFELLGELTFSSDGLKDAAAELKLPIKTTGLFARGFGSGIAKEAAVRDAAYSDDVLLQKHNSGTIELGSERAVVLHVIEHKEKSIKPLAVVTDQIEARLKKQKVSELLSEKVAQLKARIIAGADAESVAKEMGYEFVSFDDVKRQDALVDRELLPLVFGVNVVSGEVGYDAQDLTDGSQVLIAVTEVKDGALSDLESDQLDGLKYQLAQQNARFEGATFEAQTVEMADIDIY